MKSRIQIAMDWDNQPIIKIEYNPSDDVRDDMVHRFLHTFGGESCWANFYFTGTTDFGTKIASIRPIKPQELSEQQNMFNESADKFKKTGPEHN